MDTSQRGARCLFSKTSTGYFSGCGYRVAYNRHWHFCPHCGKRISNLSSMILEEEGKKK